MCLGIPARIKEIEGKKALVAFGGIEYTANLSLLEGVKKGDYVIIHAGFAIEKVDEKEALETIRLVGEIERNRKKSKRKS